jgi:hypothetical protein
MGHILHHQGLALDEEMLHDEEEREKHPPAADAAASAESASAE